MAGIEAVKVSYQGTPAAITDLLGGRIEFVITDVAVTREFINAGTLRAIGVTPSVPVGSLPDVPTIAAAGLPGYEFAAWRGLFVPAGTPKEIVATLNKAFTDAMNSPGGDEILRRYRARAEHQHAGRACRSRQGADRTLGPYHPGVGAGENLSPLVERDHLALLAQRRQQRPDQQHDRQREAGRRDRPLTKVSRSPCDRISDLRRLFSSIGPSTKASTSGAGS